MPEQRARQRLTVPFDGHVIGEGFNTDTFERVGIGLTPGREGQDQAADGQTAAFKFQMATSQASLEKALNFNAEVDVRYGLFSGGAKFSFAESSAVNTSSTYIVASCIVSNALRYGSQFQTTPEAGRLIQEGDREAFKFAFGDRFTQALRTGGEFYAVVRITSANSTTQRKIGASLHAELNGLAAGGSFKAEYEQSERESSSRTEVEIQVHQTAGIGDQVQMPGTEAAAIKAYMNRFAAAVHAHPKAFEAEVLSYNTLALPFPPLMEEEDKKRVLADCDARKRKYWTALSDIAFAQTEAAEFVFERLPPTEELLALDAEFRRVLNALMVHARAVSAGTTNPVLFVPVGEPALPRFRRRNRTSFAIWWARRNDPDMLSDEKFLLRQVVDAARPALGSAPDEQTPPELVERAADQIRRLDLSFSEFGGGPPLMSLEALPKMLDAASLEHLSVNDTQLEDLHGLEDFTRLETLEARSSRIDDLSALKGCAGLTTLFIPDNRVQDLSPLSKLVGLEQLVIGGNQVTSLDPLRGLTALRTLGLAQGKLQGTAEGEPEPPLVLWDNPIQEASALRELLKLANPFIGGDKLRIRRFKGMSEEVVGEGEAVRIGRTNRFRVAFGDSAAEVLVLLACIQATILDVAADPFVVVALHFPGDRRSGIAITRPGDPGTTMSATEMKAALAAAGVRLMFPVAYVSGIENEFSFIEAAPLG